MIELTEYDGERVGDKFSLMLSAIQSLHTKQSDTCLVILTNGKSVLVLESRLEVERLVNKYLDWVR